MVTPGKVATPADTVTAEPPLRVPAAGVGPDGERHLGGIVRCLDVAVGVLDRHLDRRGDDCTGGGVGGALNEGELGRGAGRWFAVSA